MVPAVGAAAHLDGVYSLQGVLRRAEDDLLGLALQLLLVDRSLGGHNPHVVIVLFLLVVISSTFSGASGLFRCLHHSTIVMIYTALKLVFFDVKPLSLRRRAPLASQI